ncbi:MAG: hypothetical protein GDYSWBUE_000586, partial [Candidatus Fervidibacterota bacterium]
MWRRCISIWLSSLFLACLFLTVALAQRRGLDVPFVPTPPEVVKKMLQMAGVGK